MKIIITLLIILSFNTSFAGESCEHSKKNRDAASQADTKSKDNSEKSNQQTDPNEVILEEEQKK